MSELIPPAFFEVPIQAAIGNSSPPVKQLNHRAKRNRQMLRR